MPNIRIQDIAAIILSGGQGSRMGNVDKGLVPYDGKTLIETTIQKLAPQVHTLMISANRNIDQYRRLGHRVIQDTVLPDVSHVCSELETNSTACETKDDAVDDVSSRLLGPMAGIASGLNYLLNHADYDFALISTCDTPDLPTCFVARLSAALERSPTLQMAVAHDGQRAQNLHCLIRRQSWRYLIDSFLAGQRAMRMWRQQVSHDLIDFTDQPLAFRNLNTPESLTR